MARLLHAVVTIALSVGSGGCSFLFADAPPDNHQKMLYFDCTSTPGLEVADGLFALGGALSGVGTLNMSEAEFKKQNDGGNRNTTATVQFVTAGVFVGSAIYGIVVTENCSDAKSDLRQRIIERERQRGQAPPPPAAPALAPVPPPAVAPPPPAAPPPAPSTTGESVAPPPAAPPPAAPPPAPAAPAPAAPAPAPPPPKPGSASF